MVGQRRGDLRREEMNSVSPPSLSTPDSAGAEAVETELDPPQFCRPPGGPRLKIEMLYGVPFEFQPL